MSVVLIEGNISAGKSTLCKELASRLGYRLFMEPTIANPYLAKFYQNPRKYALPMQIWLLRQRFNTYVEALNHVRQTRGGVVLDRSIYSDWVFAEKNVQDGNICREGYQYYLSLRKQMLAVLPLPTCCVYLDVAAIECQYRVHYMRRREAEAGIPLAYLEGLNHCYHTFIGDLRARGVRVFSYDWNKFGNAERVYRDVAEHCTASGPAAIAELLTHDLQKARAAPYPFALVDDLLVGDAGADVELAAGSGAKGPRSADESDLASSGSDDELRAGNDSFDDLLGSDRSPVTVG